MGRKPLSLTERTDPAGQVLQKKLQTKIIATIGPACQTAEGIRQMIEEGVDVLRLNFSHGNSQTHRRTCADIKRIAVALGRNVAVLQDLPGPKVRVGKLPDGPVALKAGERVILTTATTQNSDKIPVNHRNLHKEITRGESIYIDDGEIELRVYRVRERDIYCEVKAGGVLKDNKGINLPGAAISVKTPTPADFRFMQLGIGMGVDMVAVSFVRSAGDMLRARNFLKRRGTSKFLIAKIEKSEALGNIREIIEVSDGIMVARGDLGVEIPIEKVPGAQRLIISECNQRGKPVITATQMLDSMIERPNPTRAEATDVANAVINGADALMLSGETAIGKYPVRAVQVLRRIALEAEKSVYWKNIRGDDYSRGVAESISHTAAETAHRLAVSLILTPTRTGKTSRLVSRFKPQCPIIAFTGNKVTSKELVLSWGVQALTIDQKLPFEDLLHRMKTMVRKHGFAGKGDLVVITSGSPASKAGETNLVVVEEIS